MTQIIISLLLVAVISYLLGSCNSSIITIKLLKHEDIREKGSKNAGLTNTLRCYGKIPALITLIGDLAKGIIAVLISTAIYSFITGVPFGELKFVGYIAGIFAIIGHIFPIYYGFKGGKGILVSCSILIIIDPITFAIEIPFFIIMVAITRYVSVSSIAAAILYPIVTFCVQYFALGMPLNAVILDTVLVACTSALLIYMHKPNIIRLKNGTENKFSFKSKKES